MDRRENATAAQLCVPLFRECPTRIPVQERFPRQGMECALSASVPSSPPPGLPILVVEDNQDALEMLLAYLHAQGHDARGATTAAEGLAALGRGDVRMVVTDFRLPDHSGGWLIRTARERGLLEGVGTLICTAEHEPEPVEGATVLRKPLDLDRLDREIEAALAATHLAAMARFTGEEMFGPIAGADPAGLPDGQAAPSSSSPSTRRRTELVLYVTDSMASMRAIRNLRQALEAQDASRVRLQLCDLTREPLAGAADRVSFTPMLVRRWPTPRESLLGDLRDAERIHDLLRAGIPAPEDHE